MRLTFSVANTAAEVMYIRGLNEQHASFPPHVPKLKPQLRSLLNSTATLPGSYEVYAALKETILTGSDRPLRAVARSVRATSPVVPNNLMGNRARAVALVSALRRYHRRHAAAVRDFVTSRYAEAPRSLTCYVVPALGEVGEALRSVIVIGDGFSRDAAYLVVLEEMLHACVRQSGLPSALRRGVKRVAGNSAYREEVAVGVELYSIAIRIGLAHQEVESIVFGWHGGGRSHDVRNLIATA